MNSPPQMRAAAPSLVSAFAPDFARVGRESSQSPRVRFGVHGPAAPSARISMALLGMEYAIGVSVESARATLVDACPPDAAAGDSAALLMECCDHLQVLRAASRRIALVACDERLAVLLAPGASLSTYLRALGSFVAAALEALDETSRALAVGGRATVGALARARAACEAYDPGAARRARLDVALLPVDSADADDPLARFEDGFDALVGAAEALRGCLGVPTA